MSTVERHRFDRRMGTCPAVVWAQIVRHHPPDRPIGTTPPAPRPAPPPRTKPAAPAKAPPTGKPFDPTRFDGIPQRLSDSERAGGTRRRTTAEAGSATDQYDFCRPAYDDHPYARRHSPLPGFNIGSTLVQR
jgi:hypothetical protein